MLLYQDVILNAKADEFSNLSGGVQTDFFPKLVDPSWIFVVGTKLVQSQHEARNKNLVSAKGKIVRLQTGLDVKGK